MSITMTQRKSELTTWQALVEQLGGVDKVPPTVASFFAERLGSFDAEILVVNGNRVIQLKPRVDVNLSHVVQITADYHNNLDFILFDTITPAGQVLQISLENSFGKVTVSDKTFGISVATVRIPIPELSVRLVEDTGYHGNFIEVTWLNPDIQVQTGISVCLSIPGKEALIYSEHGRLTAESPSCKLYPRAFGELVAHHSNTRTKSTSTVVVKPTMKTTLDQKLVVTVNTGIKIREPRHLSLKIAGIKHQFENKAHQEATAEVDISDLTGEVLVELLLKDKVLLTKTINLDVEPAEPISQEPTWKNPEGRFDFNPMLEDGRLQISHPEAAEIVVLAVLDGGEPQRVSQDHIHKTDKGFNIDIREIYQENSVSLRIVSGQDWMTIQIIDESVVIDTETFDTTAPLPD